MKLTLMLSLVLAAATFTSTVDAAYKKPLLVMDMSNSAHLPRNFRTTADSLKPDINTTGLASLHIAGGSQFSKMAFQKILDRMHEKQIYIIDLRQESHGFLNSNAISWYAPNDAINAGKADEEIEIAQTQLLDELSKQDVADVFDILKKQNSYVTKVRAKQYAVHQVMNEAQFAESAKQHYDHIYVQDTYAPTNEQVDRFIDIVKAIPAGKGIYFHCRAGEGRTTTFMVMYDMMHHAKTVAYDDILTRQHALGGKDLQLLPAPASNKKQRDSARIKFLNQFYDYAKNNQDDFATSWTQWLNHDKGSEAKHDA